MISGWEKLNLRFDVTLLPLKIIVRTTYTCKS
jgi:hypothetical protein